MIRFTKAKAVRKAKPQSGGGKNSALNKLYSFLNTAEPEAIQFLVSFWNTQARGVTYAELREAYLAGEITPQLYQRWTEDYSRFIQKQLAPLWDQAMRAGAAEVSAKYPHFVYEPSIGAAMGFIKAHGAELVTNITEEQRRALNAIISHVSGYTAITPDEAARMIRPTVGLTVGQTLANARHRQAVEAAYLKAHPKCNPKTARRKAAESAARYAGRQHRYRAQNIARTELAFAYNAGHYGATKDAQARGYIGDCVKVWLTAYDERVCPICSQMDDEKRNIDEPFSNGKLLPPAHPSCRCAVAYEEIDNTNLTPGQGERPLDVEILGEYTGERMHDEVIDDSRLTPVPGRAGQGADVTGSQKPGEIVQIGTVDFSDKRAVLKQLRQAQSDFAGLDYEMNCTVTSDGKVWRVSGISGSVNPWGIVALGSILQGSYSYHNHPAAQTWYSFSAADVRYFFAAGEECAIASDDVYEYIMRRTEDVIDIDPDVAYHRFKEIEATTVAEMKWDMLIDPDMDGFHETMKILSRELNFYYERQKSK